MSDHRSAASLGGRHRLDAEEVLAALRSLYRRAASPVVQECLRAAGCEIAYLTACEGPFVAELDEDALWKDEEETELVQEVSTRLGVA